MSELSIPKPDKKLSLATQTGVTPQSLEDMWRLCVAMHNGKMAPKGLDSPDAILVAMQFGMEAGLTPFQAVNSIAVINGRPSMWGDACLALCMGRADFEDILETVEGEEAVCVVKRRGRSPVRRTFSMADAKRAGLTTKQGPWTQYPARMLQLRARGFALRDAFPDALRGIVTREEAHDTPDPKPLEKVKLVMPDEPVAQPEKLSGEAQDIDPVTGEFTWSAEK